MTLALKVRNIAKLYRLGSKARESETFAGAILNTFKSPLTNFRKYRSLYKFDDVSADKDVAREGILWALKDISFDIDEGEVVGILGRNGAGKSTLLKILSRITTPTSGIAEINGRISSLLEVGTGFHQDLTGRENVYLNGTILGMKKREVDAKFDEIIDFSGVEKFLDTPVKRYSSGMRVRLAFAVAAHLEPEILIIDEVLAVGDAAFQKKCLNKMKEVGSQGRTVLFVSHSMPAITRLCSRALLIEDGRVTEDGEPHSVIAAYMHTGVNSTARQEFTDLATAPGGNIARLVGVRVKKLDGSITECIEITEAIIIEMEFEVLEAGHVLLPHHHVLNEEGVEAFVTLDIESKWRGTKREPGRYLSKVTIPGNLMSEGMYYVGSAVVKIAPFTNQFYEKDIVAFRVVDSVEGESARGDWAGDLPGVLRPMLEWKTEFYKDR